MTQPLDQLPISSLNPTSVDEYLSHFPRRKDRGLIVMDWIKKGATSDQFSDVQLRYVTEDLFYRYGIADIPLPDRMVFSRLYSQEEMDRAEVLYQHLNRDESDDDSEIEFAQNIHLVNVFRPRAIVLRRLDYPRIR